MQESQKTRDHISTQVSGLGNRLEKTHMDDRLYDEVTKSLSFPEIFARQEQVDHEFDGIENTYDWIFEEHGENDTTTSQSRYPRKEKVMWDDFAKWLKSGHGVYWINGKAGSGKSTLMNHICNNLRLSELLKQWCHGRSLLTPSFFFWNAGSRQQKSVDGLLCSLIYQMLTARRELVSCFKVCY